MPSPYYVGLGVRSCRGGMGVYIHEWVPANTLILEFTGKRVNRDTINRAFTMNKPDRFLQVEENTFMGHSGRMDDYINHSCDPNCGLEFRDGHVYLKSIRNISFGSELTFDYSTSQSGFPFRFLCHCGSRNCRHVIGDFTELPDSRKAYYLSKGVVAPYLVKNVDPVNIPSSAKELLHFRRQVNRPLGKYM